MNTKPYHDRIAAIVGSFQDVEIAAHISMMSEAIICLGEGDNHIHLVFATWNKKWGWKVVDSRGNVLAIVTDLLDLMSPIDDVVELAREVFTDWQRFIEDVTIPNPEGLHPGPGRM